MTHLRTEHDFPVATPGFFSQVVEKTGGENGVTILAFATTLHGILFLISVLAFSWLIPVWLGMDFVFSLEAAIWLVVGLWTAGSGILIGFGRSIGWMFSTPILVAFSTGMVMEAIRKPPADLLSLMFFLPMLLLPMLTVIQGFRPTILTAFSIRPAVAALFFALPSLLMITGKLLLA